LTIAKCYSAASEFVRAHTSRNAATTAYTSGTGLQSTDEDGRSKLPRCQMCSIGGRRCKTTSHPSGATSRRAGSGCGGRRDQGFSPDRGLDPRRRTGHP
jgi:hypothetical protein